MQHPPHDNPCMRGFSVLELMIGLAIAGLALALALPSLQQFSRAQLMKSAVRQAHSDLATARSEAILRNTPVLVCPGMPQGGCADSNDWSKGWIVFADENGDVAQQAEEQLIRHGQGDPRLKITFSPGRKWLRFGTDGSTPGSNGSLVFCGQGGSSEARRLVISNVGRIRRDEAPSTPADYCP